MKKRPQEEPHSIRVARISAVQAVSVALITTIGGAIAGYYFKPAERHQQEAQTEQNWSGIAIGRPVEIQVHQVSTGARVYRLYSPNTEVSAGAELEIFFSIE